MESAEKFDCFISYSSKDESEAMSLVQRLENRGLICWIALRDIRPGAIYSDEIVAGINSCKYLIVLISKDSLKSQYVKNEVNIAADLNKLIYPVKLIDIEIDGGLRFYLSANQEVRLFDKTSDQVERLIESIRGRDSETSSSELRNSVENPVELEKSNKYMSDFAAGDPLATFNWKLPLVVGMCVVILIGVVYLSQKTPNWSAGLGDGTGISEEGVEERWSGLVGSLKDLSDDREMTREFENGVGHSGASASSVQHGAADVESNSSTESVVTPNEERRGETYSEEKPGELLKETQPQKVPTAASENPVVAGSETGEIILDDVSEELAKSPCDECTAVQELEPDLSGRSEPPTEVIEWHHDSTQTLGTSLTLCGHEGFEITARKSAPNSFTIRNKRLRTRGEGIRGFTMKIQAGDNNQLFANCLVRVDYMEQVPFPRFRLRVNQEHTQ